MGSLKDKTIIITGASRGIGRAIALQCAKKDPCKIVILAKTTEPHPKLPGTIYTVAKEIEAAGSQCLPIAVDLRDTQAIEKAIENAVQRFGGIDVLVNNAGALRLTGTLKTPMKRFDLLMAVNVRATFAMSQACIPYLKKATNPHILTLSPPINLNPKWFKDYVAYTISKYGMSMCTLGMSAEFKADGIAVNSLWPKTAISTAAVINNFPKEIAERTRKPEIMAEAAYAVLCKESKTCTGNFFIDEEILKQLGVTDFTQYLVNKEIHPVLDFYLE